VRAGRYPGAAALAAFGALTAFTSLHWVALVADPPVARALAAALILTAGAGALALSGRGVRGARFPLAIAIAIATAGAAAVALGLPAGMLAPGRWDELGANLTDGLSRVGTGDYPFTGAGEWARLSILVGLPIAGALAALLAFAARPGATRPRLGGLVVLVAVFAFAATINPPPAPMLHGLVLFALVAAWLWLPSLTGARAFAAAGLVVLAGALALVPAARLDAADPWLDYSEWTWNRASDGGSFAWDHSYGPIDWPRDGEAVLRVQSDAPRYWRTAVLDRFDGFRWLATEGGRQRDLPEQLEGSRQSSGSLRAAWTDRVRFEVVSLESRYLVGAGSVVEVDGVAGARPSAAGVLLPPRRPLTDGDSYSVLAYTPEPTDHEMRAARGRYPSSLDRFTALELPGSTALETSPYRRVGALARRLTAQAPSTFDAVEAIARHLRGNYQYSESPPRRRYPLAAFLFRDRIGYCQQFSGAMALMLRALGIPSRVAAGFSPGIATDDGFLVSDLDAHSWVEVYFNRIGWVAFDPTPAAAPASSRLARPGAPILPAGQGPQGQPQRAQPAPAPDTARAAGGDGGAPIWLAPVLAAPFLVLAALAVRTALRIRRVRSLAPEELAEAQLRELRQAIGRLRQPLPPRTTLVDLERRMRSSRRRAVAGYVARLRSARFAGRGGPANAGERNAVRRELAAGRGLRGRVMGLLAFPPGGPSS
jgi:transglutaminase-like putative cysteine protease